ncbi:MAG: transforming growth factor-beta-induced protein [Polyangiales bacterium]|jgi:transforming growth factor-beta-induced protein
MIGLMGCGDDDVITTDAGPTPDGATDAGPTDDVPSTSNTIVDVATANGNFTILLAAVERLDLTSTLNSAGPFTVFAPVDSAFDGVDVAAISDEALTQILLNHVIIGAEVPSSAIPARADNGAELTLLFGTEGGVTVNGIPVATPDVAADNGVIHVVESIIMPANVADIAGIAGLTSLAGALTAADLLGAVQDPEADLTVFAPTNDAFAAAGEVPAEALAGILTYHVIAGAQVDSGSIPAAADTLSTNEFGNNLTLLFDATDGVTINGGPSVILDLADIRTTNGIVHVIDGVLLPMNVVDAATAAGLTELLGAVGAAADIDADTTVAAALGTLSPITVFAPTNAAFEEIADTVATLSAEQVRDILLYHVVGGDAPVLSTDLANGDVPTLNGAEITIDIAGPTVNGIAIAAADINVTNGVVHVIAGVLIPAAD